MPEQPIIFQYKPGTVSGNYSFSAYSNTITLPGFVEKLESEIIREAIQYEAVTARSLYLEKVNKVRASGEKVNSGLIKREAARAARDRVRIKYAEVWDEVEATYRKYAPSTNEATTSHKDNGNPNITHLYAVIVTASESLFDRLVKAINTSNETAEKVVDTP